MQVSSWVVRKPASPIARETREETAGPGEVILEVAGCGVCHTDLAFFYDGVPTRHPWPLTLGHEISGTVVEAGADTARWLGQNVVVPAVLPCGDCPACRAGRGRICPRQIFPGSDIDGGFATHVRLPARGLCAVPDLRDRAINRAGVDLPALAVVADAVSTPYQAILKSGLTEGDVAVFVGAGGIGGFGIQVAAALGAAVVAIDVNPDRLAALASHGAALTIDPSAVDPKALRKQVRAFAESRGAPTWRTKIFETSGTREGQATAFALLGHGGHLSVVGYTPQAVEVRLSNLMALDATAEGTWGCLPEHYPAIVDLVLQGRITLGPFIERRPLATINSVFEELHAGRVARRLILIPESRS